MKYESPCIEFVSISAAGFLLSSFDTGGFILPSFGDDEDNDF